MRRVLRASLMIALLAACSRTRGLDPTVDAGDAAAAAAACRERCDDAVFCNGQEQCDPDTGACTEGQPQDCDDDDECTIDHCDTTQDECVHEARPRDEDRDGFDACKDDCDDMDPDVHPGVRELCDRIDQDCDGSADEGLRSECDDCRPGCRLIDIPEEVTGPWRPTADNSSAVEVNDAGALVLNAEVRERFDAWIALSDEDQVTKLDTRDGRQLARYDSVLLGDGTAAPPPHGCDREDGGGNCPSRTAVDLQGAVYVANRAFGAQGSVTKIAGFPEDCIDRDGDGEIQTSSDLDQNGYIDLDVPGEFLGQRDECILWTVDVGGRGSIPRALAVAGDGTVWVGLHGESRVLALDPDDGSVIESIPVPGFKPYGAVIDSGGTLWLTAALTGQILAIDTTTATAGKVKTAPSPQSGCPSSYGIAIDHRDRVWLAGFSCPYAFRYDPSDGSWFSQPIPESGVTRGIAADDLGRIFVAASHPYLEIERDEVTGFIKAGAPITRLTRFRADDGGDLRVWGSADDELAGAGAIGVGLDDQRRAWLINQETGSATRVDTETGEVKQYTVGNGPYTYSDFTGFALRRITAPSGFIREVIEGCPMGPTEWERVRVDANAPASARVEIRVRSAATRNMLRDARWFGPWDETAIDLLQDPGPLPEERFLEVEARLVAADRSTSPALRKVVVQLHCPLWSWL